MKELKKKHGINLLEQSKNDSLVPNTDFWTIMWKTVDP